MDRTRLLRTIRFDASDEHVFERAADPDEWAVSGAFAFADAEPETLTGRPRQAFRSGFLGTRSFGWSTLVTVAEISPAERRGVVDRLACHFVECYGAPDLVAAGVAAEQEVAFAQGLADQPVNTLIAVERVSGPDGVIERFRTIERGGPAQHTRIWTLVEGDGDA
jgi:hypothetical protein